MYHVDVFTRWMRVGNLTATYTKVKICNRKSLFCSVCTFSSRSCFYQAINRIINRYIPFSRNFPSFSTVSLKFSYWGHRGGWSDQHFTAKNFMGHFRPNFWGKHDGTHKKRSTASVLMKNEVNWFHKFYTSHLMTLFLRLMISDTAEFLLQIHPKRCELWSYWSDL